MGAPLRAGVVSTDGELVVWRDGRPVRLAAWRAFSPRDGHVLQAFESLHGIVLVRPEEVAIVRPDGEVESLGRPLGFPAALDRDGRHLAAVESHVGRRPWAAVHLIDLVDGSRRTLAWAEPDPMLAVIAACDGVVYLRDRTSDRTIAWRPGNDPTVLPYRLHDLDPYAGTQLASEESGRALLVRPGETPQPLDRSALTVWPGLLEPGATRLVTFTQRPESIRLTPVDRRSGDQAVFHLPTGSRVGHGYTNQSVWEDATRLLVPVDGAPLHCVRLDVRSGAFEAVPLTEASFYRPVLVRPLTELD